MRSTKKEEKEKISTLLEKLDGFNTQIKGGDPVASDLQKWLIDNHEVIADSDKLKKRFSKVYSASVNTMMQYVVGRNINNAAKLVGFLKPKDFMVKGDNINTVMSSVVADICSKTTMDSTKMAIEYWINVAHRMALETPRDNDGLASLGYAIQSVFVSLDARAKGIGLRLELSSESTNKLNEIDKLIEKNNLKITEGSKTPNSDYRKAMIDQGQAMIGRKDTLRHDKSIAKLDSEIQKNLPKRGKKEKGSAEEPEEKVLGEEGQKLFEQLYKLNDLIVLEQLDKLNKQIESGDPVAAELQKLMIDNHKVIAKSDTLKSKFSEVYSASVSTMTRYLIGRDVDRWKAINLDEFLKPKDIDTGKSPTLNEDARCNTGIVNFIQRDIYSKPTIDSAKMAIEYWVNVAYRMAFFEKPRDVAGLVEITKTINSAILNVNKNKQCEISAESNTKLNSLRELIKQGSQDEIYAEYNKSSLVIPSLSHVRAQAVTVPDKEITDKEKGALAAKAEVLIKQGVDPEAAKSQVKDAYIAEKEAKLAALEQNLIKQGTIKQGTDPKTAKSQVKDAYIATQIEEIMSERNLREMWTDVRSSTYVTKPCKPLDDTLDSMNVMLAIEKAEQKEVMAERNDDVATRKEKDLQDYKEGKLEKRKAEVIEAMNKATTEEEKQRKDTELSTLVILEKQPLTAIEDMATANREVANKMAKEAAELRKAANEAKNAATEEVQKKVEQLGEEKIKAASELQEKATYTYSSAPTYSDILLKRGQKLVRDTLGGVEGRPQPNEEIATLTSEIQKNLLTLESTAATTTATAKAIPPMPTMTTPTTPTTTTTTIPTAMPTTPPSTTPPTITTTATSTTATVAATLTSHTPSPTASSSRSSSQDDRESSGEEIKLDGATKEKLKQPAEAHLSDVNVTMWGKKPAQLESKHSEKKLGSRIVNKEPSGTNKGPSNT